METLLNTVNKFTETLIKQSKAKIAAYVKAVEEGETIGVNVDRLGRLHAMSDGEFKGEIYLKGQFVPSPFDDDPDFLFCVPKKLSFETRRAVSGSILKELEDIDQEQLDGISFKFGTKFMKHGVETRYAYFKAASKGYCNLINKWLEGAMETIKEELAEVKNHKGIAPEARKTIVATVIGLPLVENTACYYGAPTYVNKMMVELENGSTAYGSLPSSIYDDCKIGNCVEFTATFTHADNDDTHSFYKRPSKAKIIKK